jgi:hypothetical protein
MIDFSHYPPYVKRIAGVVLLIVGLVFFALLIRNTVTDFPIWFFGQHTTGVVEEKWYELIEQENSNEFAADYFLSYRFTDANGQIISGNSQMAAEEWSAYVEGREIPIVYSPLSSANNRVDDSRFVPLLLCAYIPFIIVIWFSLKQAWGILSEWLKKNETDSWVVENTSS